MRDVVDGVLVDIQIPLPVGMHYISNNQANIVGVDKELPVGIYKLVPSDPGSQTRKDHSVQTFEQAYYLALQASPPLSIAQARAMVRLENSTKTTQFVVELEQRVRRHLGISQTATVDWTESCPFQATSTSGPASSGTINWANLLALIEQLLPLILPFI